MRTVPLTSARGGIDRLRTKGSARADTLYDLVNAYVTASNSIKPRPGTEETYLLPEGTFGLTAYRSKLVVFATENIPLYNDLFELQILKHPTISDEPLFAIHFAQPFLGYLYVVAEFQNLDVFHYWLQPVDQWEGYTVYEEGDVVEPTVPNGYAYRARRTDQARLTWQPSEQRNIGDQREPTTANGYYYTIIDIEQGGETSPTNVQGSATEPTWTAEDGALVYEDVNSGNSSPATTPSTGSDGSGGSDTVPPDIEDRYRNYTGSLEP